MRWWCDSLCTNNTLSLIFIVLAQKQQSADRHVVPLWHSSLIPSQLFSALYPWCCVLSREATHANYIVLSLTWSGSWVEPANHYTTDAFVLYSIVIWVREWLLFNANSAIFSYIMARTSYFSMRWWWSPLCTSPIRWVGFL
jgi:hypothetical protein